MEATQVNSPVLKVPVEPVDPCYCVRCFECGGSGRVEVETGGYPEWELESCPSCRGDGIEEVCSSCRDIEDSRTDL